MLRNVSLFRMSNNVNLCPFKSISSIHGDQIAEIHDVPMNAIIRPFLPELDDQKVSSLMETLNGSVSITIRTRHYNRIILFHYNDRVLMAKIKFHRSTFYGSRAAKEVSLLFARSTLNLLNYHHVRQLLLLLWRMP